MSRDLINLGASAVSFEQVCAAYSLQIARVASELQRTNPAARSIGRHELQHHGLVGVYEAMAKAAERGVELPRAALTTIARNEMLDWIKSTLGHSRSRAFQDLVSWEEVSQSDGATQEAGPRSIHALVDSALTEVWLELAVGVTIGQDPVPADPERAAMLGQLAARADAAMDDLSLRERKVLRLAYGDGLTTRQIAERLGISTSYVEQLKRRGVDQLKAGLQKAESVLLRRRA